jgi:hypothetical protein
MIVYWQVDVLYQQCSPYFFIIINITRSIIIIIIIIGGRGGCGDGGRGGVGGSSSGTVKEVVSHGTFWNVLALCQGTSDCNENFSTL